MRSDHGNDHRQVDPTRRYLAPLREYRETVLRLFPEMNRRALHDSISPADALFLGYFLEHYPRSVVALEIGARVGDSAFCLASHPKVLKVVSVNLNPLIAEEFAAHSISDGGPGAADSEPPRNFRMLDIARATIAEYPEEQGKITFLEGPLGDVLIGVEGEPARTAAGAETSALTFPKGNGLVALVDGLHDRESVSESLKAVFDRDQHAVVFVDDCRHERGPFVQAGVADFMDEAREEHRFRPVASVGPALASSDLAVLYSGSVAAETERTLGEVGRMFSRKLDPLRLLGREEELMNAVSKLNRQLSQTDEHRARLDDEHKVHLEQRASQLEKKVSRLEAQVARLKARNAELLSRYSSRRYRLADILAEKALRVPVVRELLRRNAPPSGGG